MKDFIQHYEVKFVNYLMQHNNEPYIIINCLHFIEKNQYFPLSQGQADVLINHLSTLRIDGNILISNHVVGATTLLKNRKKNLGSFATLSF